MKRILPYLMSATLLLGGKAQLSNQPNMVDESQQVKVFRAYKDFKDEGWIKTLKISHAGVNMTIDYVGNIKYALSNYLEIVRDNHKLEIKLTDEGMDMNYNGTPMVITKQNPYHSWTSDVHTYVYRILDHRIKKILAPYDYLSWKWFMEGGTYDPTTHEYIGGFGYISPKLNESKVNIQLWMMGGKNENEIKIGELLVEIFQVSRVASKKAVNDSVFIVKTIDGKKFKINFSFNLRDEKGLQFSDTVGGPFISIYPTLEKY